jgi:histidine triad (HIT) family protein
MTSSPATECLFCRIVAGEIPATIVAQTDGAVAFTDIAPVAPTHVVVIPRVHMADLAALSADADSLSAVMRLAADIAQAQGLAATGWRLVVNTGEAAGQTVFHVHAHVLGGRALHWPPG